MFCSKVREKKFPFNFLVAFNSFKTYLNMKIAYLISVCSVKTREKVQISTNVFYILLNIIILNITSKKVVLNTITSYQYAEALHLLSY